MNIDSPQTGGPFLSIEVGHTGLSKAASLRARRKRGNFRPADGIPTVGASLMQEPFFFEGGVVDLATDAWD